MVLRWYIVGGFAQGDQKLKKSQKLSGVHPVLWVYRGLVVLRRACTLIIRVKVDNLQLRKSIVIVYD